MGLTLSDLDTHATKPTAKHDGVFFLILSITNSSSRFYEKNKSHFDNQGLNYIN